jgi:hypothetical protein
MKIFITTSLMLISLNAFSATVKDCQTKSDLRKDVIVVSGAGIESIKKILSSKETQEKKKELAKSILSIESLSIGDGNSVCEMASSKYAVKEEHCMDVMKSDDLVSALVEGGSATDESLDCSIGVTSKLLMIFDMN